MRVSRALGGVTVLQKGEADRICTNTGKASKEEAKLNQIKEGESAEELVIVDVPGGYKRCGGQGDVLSGAVGTIMAWGKCYEEGAYGCVLSASSRALCTDDDVCSDGSIPPSRIPLLAAVGGSLLTRTASRRAFGKQGRSTSHCIASYLWIISSNAVRRSGHAGSSSGTWARIRRGLRLRGRRSRRVGERR